MNNAKILTSTMKPSSNQQLPSFVTKISNSFRETQTKSPSSSQHLKFTAHTHLNIMWLIWCCNNYTDFKTIKYTQLYAIENYPYEYNQGNTEYTSESMNWNSGLMPSWIFQNQLMNHLNQDACLCWNQCLWSWHLNHPLLEEVHHWEMKNRCHTNKLNKQKAGKLLG